MLPKRGHRWHRSVEREERTGREAASIMNEDHHIPAGWFGHFAGAGAVVGHQRLDGNRIGPKSVATGIKPLEDALVAGQPGYYHLAIAEG